MSSVPIHMWWSDQNKIVENWAITWDSFLWRQMAQYKIKWSSSITYSTVRGICSQGAASLPAFPFQRPLRRHQCCWACVRTSRLGATYFPSQNVEANCSLEDGEADHLSHEWHRPTHLHYSARSRLILQLGRPLRQGMIHWRWARQASALTALDSLVRCCLASSTGHFVEVATTAAGSKTSGGCEASDLQLLGCLYYW